MKTIGDVLDALVAEGAITESESQLKNAPETASPWFIQAFMGLGGWIGALFFFAFAVSCFAFTFGFLWNEFALGLAFSIFGAVCLLATTTHLHANFSENLFASQFRLVAHITGHVMLVFGLSLGLQLWRYTYGEAVTGFVIVLQALVFTWLYPDGIFRFLASIAFVIGLNIIVYDFQIAGSLSLLIGFLGFTLFYIFGGLMPAKQEFEHFELLQSVPYGLTFAFFGTILHELSYSGWPSLQHLYQPYISSILLLVLLFWMVIRLLRSYKIGLFAPNALFIFGLLLVIGLPTLNTPGIIAGIFLSLIAFRRKNWILLSISYACLACFIIYFYHNLTITLDIKSYILMGTGLAMLLGRVLLQRVLPELKDKETA